MITDERASTIVMMRPALSQPLRQLLHLNATHSPSKLKSSTFIVGF